MDAEIKAKWIEALRSGEFKQGKGRLRLDDEFCCLGVLCELVDPAGWTWRGEGRFSHNGFGAYPSPAIEGRAGLPSTGGTKVAQKNDDGASFSEIADYIEANF